MNRAIAVVAGVLILVLWVTGGLRAQSSVGGDEATVQAQLTAVVHPTATPTPIP